MAVAGLAQGTDTGAASVPGPPLLWLIGAAGVAAATTSVALALTSDHVTTPGIKGALNAWVVLGYVFAGLIAWLRRPRSRLGPLMLAAALGMFLSSLQSANGSLPFTIGVVFDLAAAVLFLHVFLPRWRRWRSGRSRPRTAAARRRCSGARRPRRCRSARGVSA